MEKLSHIDFGFTRPVTTRELKDCHEAGDFQFHRWPKGEISPDPLHGQNEEWDRVVAALTELYYLDLHVQAEARAIFKKYGLADHGFACTVRFHHVPEWDTSEDT